MKNSNISNRKVLFFLLFVLFFFSAKTSWAEDCWLSVSGAGLKNGKSASDAYSASEGKGVNAQICWNQTSPDGTMHIMEGEYSVKNGTFWPLQIAADNDGSKAPEGKYKKMLGEGKVVLRGPRRIPYDPSMQAEGGTWIYISRGAGRVWVQNFYVSQVAEGIAAKEGGNVDLQFHDLHFEDTRQNLIIFGHPDCKARKSCNVEPDALSHDILIENTWGLRYSKRHVRLGQGIFNVRVVNSHANAEFLDGDFAVGFDVENPSHDIEFNHCTSRGNSYSLSEYWNGDGFKSEDETKNIRWINCSAFDNGDGGFDIKTENAYLENIVALRNNRNIRLWSSEKSIVKNANASYTKHLGGEGTMAGLWSSGVVECHFCTLQNNKTDVMAENNGKGAKITFFDSILSANSPDASEWVHQEEGTSVDLVRTVEWKAGATGVDPKFGPGATADWEGGNEEFNSQLYGKTKGYHYG